MRPPDAALSAQPPSPDLADLLGRAQTGLNRAPPGPGAPLANPRGDHDLDPDGLAVAPPAPYRLAAVLVPILAGPEGLHVLLTQRAAHLRDHSGQIAFPGGKIEPDDGTPAEAALREAREEIGLPPDRVRVLGYLDPYLSATGFLVSPVVGLVEGAVALAPNPDEVAEVFAVPLGFLMEPGRHQIRTGTWRGRQRRTYAIPFEDRVIWGVTAGIIHNLSERLFPAGSAA